MKKYSLEIIVFITGAVVMILELVGSRIISPYAGTSLIVWTSLIGIILGSLSIGYSIGGRLADKKPSEKMLGNILLFSALLVGLINSIEPISLFIVQRIADIRVASVVIASVLFAPSSVVLGMVPTYAVRLRIKNVKTSGSTVGRLYALSTVGSIVGTFLAGFYLISFFGSSRILLLMAIILAATSLLAFTLNLRRVLIVVGLILMAHSVHSGIQRVIYSGYIVEDVDSNYSRVMVTKFFEKETERPILALITGRAYNPVGLQTAVYEDDKTSTSAYIQYFTDAENLVPNLDKVLLLGGGGYAHPRSFVERHKDAQIDVVEIDPILTKMAEKYFGLEDEERINIFHQDARTFLNSASLDNNTKKYDMVFVDVFSASDAIPFHLTTLETISEIKNILNSNGLVVMNTISSVEGDTGKYFRAQLSTYEKVFPFVHFYLVDEQDVRKIQNIIIVAGDWDFEKLAKDNLSEPFSSLYEGEVELDVPVLTDDFAPVDQYYMDVERALSAR
jgi:spermidine synthase